MKYLIALSSIVVLCLAGWFWFQNPSTNLTSYYGRVLFGSNPSDSSAWQHFIVQGSNVFIDKNKDNIANESELFVWSETTDLQVNGKKFTVKSAQTGIAPESVSDSLPQRLELVVNVHEKRPYQMAGKMLLTEKPDQCNWLQFGGDLRFIVMDQPKLKAGSSKAAELKIFIGTSTAGPPPSNDSGFEPSSIEPDIFRTAIVLPVRESPYPSLELAFSQQDSVTPSQQLVLDEFC